ncbi:ABC transporter ATP-binding protein [Parvularcula flava]|uniref:ABC transporter ATP-binding protein n=2 Tax=Aquisalinus luteolus TaxID=1566827 RepID=A0A8J3A3E5_9PROT|nr:ABC transporter ATP-binding protein [Aquisalinus luteolus]GGH99290.1 ABC transporter ATP-binding protein [Aquisalinus luteolus]
MPEAPEDMSVSRTPDSPILELNNLTVDFETPDGVVNAVKGVSLAIRAGECVGIVGESGSGKSQTCLSALGLVADNGRVSGEALYHGEDLLKMKAGKRRQILGDRITMIFQDPLTSLTPHMTIGDQMGEVLALHKKITGEKARQRSIELLERVRIPEAARRLKQYPHELSGGMRQRVMIAMSLLGDPELLIADEPTTALDVTVQAQILDIMADLKTEQNMGIAIITHDMGVVARMCDRVMVMKNGEFVEAGTADEIFYNPQKDYTKMLLDAMPRIDQPDRHGRPAIRPVPADAETILEVDEVKVHYPVTVGSGLFPKKKPLRAVDGVTFNLKRGETLGVVGESGCGKSTLARAILQFAPIKKDKKSEKPVVWLGKDLTSQSKAKIRSLRKDFQIIFQDPLAALDPRMTIGASIAEPLKTHKSNLGTKEINARVRSLLERVGLPGAFLNRYPHELSGGQNQRVGIARAMILEPEMVICDEAVSALDVSVQAQIIDLLIDLQHDFGTSLIFISHDLSVVREVSHRVMVLYLGQIVELADRDTIYEDARHPYTKALISAVPTPDPKIERSKPRVKLEGDLPSPLDTRAPLRFLKSKVIDDPDAVQYRPKLIEVSPGHWVAEHDPVEEATAA